MDFDISLAEMLPIK